MVFSPVMYDLFMSLINHASLITMKENNNTIFLDINKTTFIGSILIKWSGLGLVLPVHWTWSDGDMCHHLNRSNAIGHWTQIAPLIKRCNEKIQTLQSLVNFHIGLLFFPFPLSLSKKLGVDILICDGFNSFCFWLKMVSIL